MKEKCAVAYFKHKWDKQIRDYLIYIEYLVAEPVR